MKKLFRLTKKGMITLGDWAHFVLRILIALPKLKKNWDVAIKQFFFQGSLSFFIVVFASFFIGAVLAIQGYNTLRDFGSQSALGALVSLAVYQELGPVVTALLFAGRAGSSLTSELTIMKISEQMKALDMMAISPSHHVFMPRFLASMVVLPMLTVFFIFFALIGGHTITAFYLNADVVEYWSQISLSVGALEDLVPAVIKSLVFAFIISTISLYQGYKARASVEGISYAITHAVVYASLWVLLANVLLTMVMFD